MWCPACSSGRLLLQPVECRDWGGDEVGVEVSSLKQKPQRLEDIGLIIGHQHTRTHDRSLDNQRAS